ncbi:MAG: hypothetical protein JXB49_21505 [Bacteroidales bacterium]|nr:hypothetical protein [Bacteroidales bacterium]
MYTLDIEQISIIESLVEKEDMHFSHLKEDLVDHICCDIEVLMDGGLKFKEALKKVKKEIGIGGLKKIQESTLFLIDKKYRNMKRTMRIFGLVSPTLMALGGLFKIQHWPGAGIMLTLGAVLLSFVFLPSAIIVMYKETQSKKRVLVYVAGFIGGFAYILGILFKIQHWPGAGILLTVGLGFLALVFLPSLLVSKCIDETNKKLIPVWIISFSSIFLWILGLLCKIMHWPGASILLLAGMTSIVIIAIPAYFLIALKDYNYIKGSFIFLVIAITEVLLTSGLMQLNISSNFLNSFIDTENNLKTTIQYLDAKNLQFIETQNDSAVSALFTQIKSNTNKLTNEIQDIKIKLVNAVEGENAKNVIIDNHINTLWLQNKDDIKVTDLMLFGGEKGDGMAKELQDGLKYYTKYLSGFINNQELLDIIYSDEVKTDNGKSISWDEYMFKYVSFIAVLNRLSLLQRNVLYAESLALNAVYEKSLVK